MNLSGAVSLAGDPYHVTCKGTGAEDYTEKVDYGENWLVEEAIEGLALLPELVCEGRVPQFLG